MLVAANPLIEVRLGLDGLDDRLLRDHVLRPQEIRVRCNPEARSTSGGSASASSIEEAEKARTEARRLLEEHRALIGQARGQSEQILAEARKVAESMARRVKEETEADRHRRLEETKRQIEAETQRALHADPRRGGRADAHRDREGHRQGARRLRPQAPDRGRDRRPRLLGARAQGDGPIAAVHRTYARALFEAAKEQGPPEGGRPRSSATSPRPSATFPSCAPCCVTPSSTRETKAGIVGEIIGDADPLLGNFLRLVAEKGRIGEIEEIAREFDRLMAAEEAPARRRARPPRSSSRSSDAAGDSEADSRGVGPRGRSDAESRSQSDRRFRPAGRLHARRRIRARPDRGLAP